jgi:DinB superfamily
MSLAVVKSRVIRLKTPILLDPEIVHEKEEMLGELRQVRERTLALIEETMERDLSKYRMPHPFLGSLNTYEWFQLIASHQIRHTKQMREIAGTLPKTVTSLEK